MENKILDHQTESTKGALPISLKYGLILGLVSTITTIAFTELDMMDYSGQNGFGLNSIITNIVSFGLTIFLLYTAINEHKQKELGGYISIGRAVKIGALIGLIAGLISAIGMGIYFGFINTTVLSDAVDQIKDKMEEQGMAPEQAEQAANMTRIFMSPMAFGIIGTIMSVIMDTIFSLIIGAIIKKERSPFSNLPK